MKPALKSGQRIKIILSVFLVVISAIFIARSLPSYLNGSAWLAAVSQSSGPATLVATSIVCEKEFDLPNWGDGSSPKITSDTASSWIASHPGCHGATGWYFEWANSKAQDAGSSLVGPAGSPYTTFGPTDNSGIASVKVSPLEVSSGIYLREILKDGYVPFSGRNTAQSVSAEFYCHTDGMYYSNFDRIDKPVAGGTYYCIGFNTPRSSTPAQTGTPMQTPIQTPTPPIASNPPPAQTPAPIPTPTPSPLASDATSTPPIVTPPASQIPAAISDAYTAASTATAGWGKLFNSFMLGNTFEEANPGTAADDRPTNYKQADKNPRPAAYIRIKPYQLGTSDTPDTDYWSVSGQVGYVPDATDGSDPGLARIQTYAYYDHVFALSPRLDYASSKTPNPDPSTTRLPNPKPKVIANVRSYGLVQNEALVLYDDGLLTYAGTQTSRSWDRGERNQPTVQFPKGKVPTGLALTSQNEFALVTIWDTAAKKGQLAVVALEGKYIPSHTMPYMGMANEGSWSDFKLLGYIDLPFAYPTAVAAASNARWNGPSQTGNLDLGKIDIASETIRKLLYDGAWRGMVASKGYAIVASRAEDKVAFVDLTPLFSSIKESYLSSATSLTATLANRGAGDDQFPKVFSSDLSEKPIVSSTYTVSKPTSVLAGQTTDRWSKETNKAYVASENGTISIYDTSSWMARTDIYPDKASNALSQLGSFYACKNPTGMAFTRFGEGSTLPGAPSANTPVNGLNNTFYIACRGDREVDAAVVWGGTGSIYRHIKDSRMGDPVAVSMADRGKILVVADFNGKKILSFRIGAIKSRDGQTTFGAGADGNADFEFAGELSLPGKPFSVSQVNVN